MVKFILGISGKQGAGKSTLSRGFSEAVSKRWGLKCLSLAFADPIYDIHDSIQSYFGSIGVEFVDKNGPLLQQVGDLGKSVYGNDIWVRAFKTAVEDIHMKGPHDTVLIVDDIRFPQEVEAVRKIAHELGVYSSIVRLSADEQIRKERCDGWRTDTTHASEVALDQYGEASWHTSTSSSSSSSVWDLEIDTGQAPPEDTLAKVLEATQDRFNLIDPEKVRIAQALQDLNEALAWLKSRSKGANFKWVYTPEGTKELSLISIDPVVPLSKDQEDMMAARTKEILEALNPSQVST